VGTESGTKFTEVDLSDKEWTDYDEKVGNILQKIPCSDLFNHQAKKSVEIMELESKWERAP
jgi:hypothetical protein